MRRRAIYHITHYSNLAGIIAAGRLWSDAQRRVQKLQCQNVGYEHIKARRMRRPVTVHPGTTLGQYVPFNFCPRSVMLYVLHRGHEGYDGGQTPIVHLVSSVGAAVGTSQRWAFTDRHADLAYADFFADLSREDEVNWSVMNRQQWGGDSEVKACRQAEFLVFDWFPWEAIVEIGVIDRVTATQVEKILQKAKHQPPVRVKRGWYY